LRLREVSLVFPRLIGEIIDARYQIVRLLGEGGMGCVYEAQTLATGERVALKLIGGDFRKAGSTLLSRFEREAKAATGIDSPHISRVLDFGTNPATKAPFMVMEYLEGEDLQVLIKRVGPLAPEAALRIAAQACAGLRDAHAARVVHRDIKPANLFLVRRGDGEILVKILDFGIAKIRREPGEGGRTTGLTTTGRILGSPLYMAPEQVDGNRGADPRTDVWSLGVSLYAALAGRAPHQHIQSIGKLLVMLCTEPPPPLQDAAPWVSPEIAAIVHRALQIDMDQRFPSAEAVLEALAPLLPDGTALREDLLGPIDEAERAVVAPRLTVQVATTLTLRKPRGSGAAEATARSNPNEESLPFSASDSGVSRSRSGVLGAGAPSGRGVYWPRLAGALLALGLGGLALYTAVSPGEGAQPGRRASGGAVRAEAPRSASAAPSVSAVPAVDLHRRVRLSVAPGDVSVEVDGRRVEVQDGVVEVAGTLGSVHRVRLSLGGDGDGGGDGGDGEVTSEVVVTENGAVPPRVSLEVTRPAGEAVEVARPAGGAVAGAKGPKPRPGLPAASTQAPVAPPSAKKADPLVPDKFQ
jgi:eukaryotic-like serine/threonine-protein kinase